MSPTSAKIRLGMVGGGQGAFIGEVHRIAARLDNRYELVAGALSSDTDRAAASAAELGLAADRSYANFADMASIEAGLDHGIQACAIVTPNHMHYPVAKAMLEAGIHVICDKPLTSTMADALALTDLVKSKQLVFAVTYNYSGYPMVRQAREMVAAGELGKIRIVQVEYPQDWLSTRLEDDADAKQAIWRTDPERSGAGGCISDIGTHAFHLANFISGLEAEELLADLHSFVDGRRVDDNAHVLLRYAGGAKGMLWSSQVAAGNENSLRVRIYGDKAGLQWAQEDPNYLIHTPLDQCKRILSRAGAGATSAATQASRIPAGHPEAFLEAFANIYRDAADLISARLSGSKLPDENHLVPDVDAGLKGIQFVAQAIASSAAGGVWKKL